MPGSYRDARVRQRGRVHLRVRDPAREREGEGEDGGAGCGSDARRNAGTPREARSGRRGQEAPRLPCPRRSSDPVRAAPRGPPPPLAEGEAPSKGRGFKPSDPSKPFSAWSKEERDAFRAEKRRKEEERWRRRRRGRSVVKAPSSARSRPPRTAAAGRPRSAASRTSSPSPLKQKILANYRRAVAGDVRAVSANWRDAVDDEAFLRFAKMAAHLRGWAHNAGRNKTKTEATSRATRIPRRAKTTTKGSRPATTPALVAQREAHADWFRERGVVNAAGVVQFLASHVEPSRRPFATPLACEALVDALRDAEAEREHARSRSERRSSRFQQKTRRFRFRFQTRIARSPSSARRRARAWRRRCANSLLGVS